MHRIWEFLSPHWGLITIIIGIGIGIPIGIGIAARRIWIYENAVLDDWHNGYRPIRELAKGTLTQNLKADHSIPMGGQ